MKSALLTTVQFLAAWSVISVVAGAAISRTIGRLQRSVESAEKSPGLRPPPPIYLDGQDAVEATGEVSEEPLPVEQWPDEALARLRAAIKDPEGFDEECQVYELRSELDLLGVAGFTQRWKWRDRERERDTEREGER